MLENLELTFEIRGLKKHLFLVPYLVCVLIFFSTFLGFRKQLDKLKQLRQSNEKEEKVIINLKKQVSQIESISATEIEGRINKILFTLPVIKDPILILSSAKGLALRNNLMIEEINFSPGQLNKGSHKTQLSNLDNISISFQLKGELSNMVNFFQKVNQVSPFMAAENFSIKFNERELLLTANFNSYFSPLATRVLAEKGEVTLLQSEEQTYQEINSWQKVGFASVEEKEEFVPEDKKRNPFLDEDENSVPLEI